MLQRQYQKVFSDPDKADIAACMSSPGLPQGLEKGFKNCEIIRDDIINALKEVDPYSVAPEEDIPTSLVTN